MSLFQKILGNAVPVDCQQALGIYKDLFTDGETLEHAYKYYRDLIFFTNLRLIFVNKKGLFGKLQEIDSVPYSSISQFNVDKGGLFQLDNEIKLWVTGKAEPIVLSFEKDTDMIPLAKWFSDHTLKI